MASVEKDPDNGGAPYLSFGDGMPLGWEVMAATGRNRTSPLKNLQRSLRGLRESTDAGDISCQYAIDKRYGRDNRNAPPDSQRKRLSSWGSSVIDYYAYAPLPKLDKFVRENEKRFDMQTQALHDITPHLVQVTRQAVEDLAATVLPRHAAADFEHTIAAVGRLRSLDSFEAGGMNAFGYFTSGGGEPRIYLANGFDDREKFFGSSRMLESTAFHEYSHAVGDVTGQGFSSGLTGEEEEPLLSLIEEPYVAHLTKIAMSHPSLREEELDSYTLTCGREPGTYIRERLFIGRLGIPAELLHEAAFSKRSDGSSIARTDLARRLHSSVGQYFPEYQEHGFYTLATQYRETARCKRSQLVDGWLQRLGIWQEDEMPKGLDAPAVSLAVPLGS